MFPNSLIAPIGYPKSCIVAKRQTRPVEPKALFKSIDVLYISFVCKVSIFESGNNGLELLGGVLHWFEAFLTIVEDVEGFIMYDKKLVKSLYVVHAKAMGLKSWTCVW